MSLFIPFGFYKQSVIAELDPDAQAFLTATGITDPTITSAINTFVIDLKSAGIWSKMLALYPFVGGTATTHKYNLINPVDSDAAYRLTFNGTVTHSSNGIVGNGTNGYYNTNMPGTDLTQDDASMFVYIRNNVSEGRVDMGYLQNATTPYPGLQLNSRSTSNTMTTRCHSSNPAGTGAVSVTTSVGLSGVSRDNATDYNSFRDKSHNTITKSSVAPYSGNIFGLCFNLNGSPALYSTRQQALAGLGYSLTTGEIDSLVDINQTFQTTLGRFV